MHESEFVLEKLKVADGPSGDVEWTMLLFSFKSLADTRYADGTSLGGDRADSPTAAARKKKGGGMLIFKIVLHMVITAETGIQRRQFTPAFLYVSWLSLTRLAVCGPMMTLMRGLIVWLEYIVSSWRRSG